MVSTEVQTAPAKMFEGIKWREKFGLECFAVRLNLCCNRVGLRKKLADALPQIKFDTRFEDGAPLISLIVNRQDLNGLYYKGKIAHRFKILDAAHLEVIADKILVILALNSLPDKFFLHAGAIVYKNQTIIFPGASYSGKTTLVKSFIESGADYITDDLTIMGNKGIILPLPRPLGVRTQEGRKLLLAKHFGAQTIKQKTALKMIVFTQFEAGAVWQPQRISEGQTVMGLLDNFYYKPSIGDAPGEILQGLAEIVAGVEVFAGKRGDAHDLIEWVARRYA